MKIKSIFILVVAIAAISYCNAADLGKKKTTTTTTEEPTTSSTPVPPEPTTTAATTTTTTTTTTTEAPITTTEAPTTTTTTVAPPTTPKPTPAPVPFPDVNTWSYKDSTTNKICVIARMAVQLNLTYETFENENITALYNIPANKTKVAGGRCSNETDELSVEWDKNSNFNLKFDLNKTTSDFYLSTILFNIAIDNTTFVDAKTQTINLYMNGEFFETPESLSYHCTKPQQFNVSNKDGLVAGHVTLAHLQFEAFQTKDNENFSTAKDCDAIDTPDIVPIAVGCALAGLVLVVLIAYLVGRRRAQSRGYLSM